MKSSSPPALSLHSSAPSPDHQRPKSLPLHDYNVPDRNGSPSAQKRGQRKGKPPQLDSANFLAARRLLSERLESGLTQEELAAVSGESVDAIARRERAEVWLGPLRAVVVLERVKTRGVK